MKSVAIIGAGITGLTAGFRLKQKNIPVTVYEASDRVGGVIRSVRQDGYLAEFGPNTLLDTSPKIREIIHAAGLTNRMMYSDERAGNRYLVRHRKTIAMPASLFGFLKTDLFSFPAKLKLFREPFIPPWSNAYEESVAQFVLRRLGQEFLDYAIDALVAGIYAGDPYRLSVIHGFPKLYELEQKYGSLIKGQILGARERKRRQEVSKQEAKKISFDEGLQVLPDILHQHLRQQLLLGQALKSLQPDPEGWTLTVQENGACRTCRHSAVVLALPTYQLAQITFGAGNSLSFDPLPQIHYPPVASVVLGYRRKDVAHPLDGFGMLIPKAAQFQILGTLFSSSLFPNRAPDGYVTLTSYVGGMRCPELALRDPADLYAITNQDLRTLLGITGEPTFRHCVLYRQAIPQYEVGYGRNKQKMDDLETQAPGLFFAGHYRTGISLSDSLCAGYDVVDKIEKFLQPNVASLAQA
jgi:protoporphyrinogen/coproporphyrinogen III oxidase